jgi:DNA-directed RNA polymerase subunit E'/Rpb7
MKLVSPYRNIKQYTKILIEPYHMNSDIRINMKNILQKKIEKKCNKNGYVEEVYRIIEYSDGIMLPENLSGSAIYNIAYHCKICLPIENTIIIGLVKIINQEIIIANNGPIMIFISKENIDVNVWDVNDNYLNKNNKEKLKINNYVKIQIIDKRINQYDVKINVIGKLLDFASEEEVDTYFGSKIIDNKKKLNLEEENVNDINESNFIS